MNPHKAEVLALYKRAMRLALPYVESPGVKEFMRREMVREMQARRLATHDEILEVEKTALDKDTLLHHCREQVRELFREQAGESAPHKVEYLVRQGHAELNAVEDQIIKQKKNFGVVKDGENVKYVVKPSSE
ncbi:hypothetical protein QOT17_013327 [Balamuthia mandrillaris]